MKKFLWFAMVIILTFGMFGCSAPAAEKSAEPVPSQTQQATVQPSVQSTAQPSAEPSAEVLVFNDPVLEERVRAQMNKPEGDITTAEAEAVKELELENKDNKPDESISDISALASFKNLKKLKISLNNISDLSPLSGMNLEVFYSMNGNSNITDFSPLAGSTAMLDLEILGNSNINDSNIGFIDGMSNMKLIWIGNSPQLTDISAVANFSKLVKLAFTRCNISDISAAKGLKNLKEVYLEGNPVKDYSPLKDVYPNLEKKDFEMK